MFCRTHEGAPAGRRGGWVSAERRRRRMGGEHRLDASNIATRLWVGGTPPLDRDLPDFDLVALCAQEIQPEQVPFHGVLLRCPMVDDHLDTPQVLRAVLAGRRIAQHLIRGDRVLVTGQRGLNRPALVASFALAYVTRLGADDLVHLLRTRRDPRCLGNPYFTHLIQRMIGASRPAVTR